MASSGNPEVGARARSSQQVDFEVIGAFSFKCEALNRARLLPIHAEFAADAAYCVTEGDRCPSFTPILET